ncbi:MAG: TetR/AcrR family transcriptional regulator [Nannocystaceae bacterium]
MTTRVVTVAPACYSDSSRPVSAKPSAAPRRRRPVQSRSRQTVDAIVEAAARLFDRGSATTNGIAKLAGVSIGSLYEYFPNKDAILESLVDRHVAEAEAVLREQLARLGPDGVSLEDGVRGLVWGVLRLHEDRPGLHRKFVQGFMGRPAVRKRIRAAELRLREGVVEWLRGQAEVGVRDVELAARVVVEGTNALVHQQVESDEGVEAGVFVEEVVRLWVGYLRGA